MSFPKSDERKRCWEARDGFWQCLTDKKEDPTKCTAQRVDFENSCTKQWVKYFDRRRDYLKFKEKMEKEGYDPVKAGKSQA